MAHVDLRIEGMSCNHCVMAVRKELQKLDGVTVKEVRVGAASVDYDELKVQREQINAAIEEAGYTVVS